MVINKLLHKTAKRPSPKSGDAFSTQNVVKKLNNENAKYARENPKN